MPDMWMDVDTALAEVPVNIAQLIDDGDFKAREESVTYDQAGMDLVWKFTTTGGATTQTAVTPTTAGVYDWANQGNGMYSIEIPASGGGSINNDTEGFGYFIGYATGILPWRGPVIGFRAAALNNALIDGGDLLDVNVTEISGDSGAADNEEKFFDGTGYAGTNNVIPTVTTLTGHTAQGGDSFSRIGAAGVSLTDLGGMSTGMKGEIESEANDALVALNLDHLLKTVTAAADMTTEVADNTVMSRILANGDTSAFDPSTDGLQPIRDNGDSAWSSADVSNLDQSLSATESNIRGSDSDDLKTLSIQLDTAQTDLDTLTGTDGVTLATAQALYAPAKAGDLMGLATDAITAAKYDESTAFPVKANDVGATQIARVGADGDTLETLSDQLDVVQVDLDNTAQYKADVSGIATPANVATALTDIHLDHLLAATYDPASPPGAADALLNELVENDGGVARYTENALEQAPSGTGSSAAALWSYGSRTLTQSGASVTAAVTGSDLAAVRGDTFTAAITGLGTLTNNDQIWFTVKTSRSNADSAAIIGITRTGGLVRINGAVVATAANGSITVDDAAAGNITIVLKAVESAKLSIVNNLFYDIQWVIAGVVLSSQGTLTVGADVTLATS